MSALNSCLKVGAFGQALLGALCIAGCAPQPLADEEVDVVATRRSETADFEELRTFSMPKAVIDLCDELGEIQPGGLGGAGGEGGAGSLDGLDSCTEPDHSLDDLALDTIANELEGLGYEEVDSDAHPDIAVLVGLVAQTELHLWEGVPWCYAHDLFRGCWDPGYEYPYNLKYGTLLMDFALPGQSEDELVSVWTTILSGVARPDADEDVMTAAIEQAFEQSPYLEDGGAP